MEGGVSAHQRDTGSSQPNVIDEACTFYKPWLSTLHEVSKSCFSMYNIVRLLILQAGACSE